jgi:hypothetical protein
MESDQTRVTLELDLGATPIQGSIERGGDARRFEGWIELASLIEAAAEVPGSGERPREVGRR